MNYFYIAMGFIIAHFATHYIDWISDRVDYINYTTDQLIKDGKYTDGCSIPLIDDLIHKYLTRSRTLCAGHDYAGRGWLINVPGGWYGNLISWFAHMNERNPVYWAWGSVAMVATLPWVVWRRDFGIELIPIIPFHLFLLVGGGFITLYKNFG